ncbi:Calmodulin-binding protein 25 [Sesamum alatum]|uniref:Calmodulin-binding protein 25 n=1 Tax=Sesamum alatum TaxID=300844 RepID=A0AAE1YLX2_9LAMI|nr:Calmodulin-binding protein 25 [Sesamum alatum]
MASYDNLTTIEQPWSFRPAFAADAWISDVFAKENDAITKALQNSFTSTTSEVFSAGMVESLFAKPDVTPTPSGGSENDAPVSKLHRRSLPPSGRVAKRKSRKSKRAATTTFISADPENFRQMVQQVTGVKFGGLNVQLPVAPVWTPDPSNPVQLGGGLPTLDTSAFLLDGSASSTVYQPLAAVGDGGAAATEHYFDSFCSFPTLESWKAM